MKRQIRLKKNRGKLVERKLSEDEIRIYQLEQELAEAHRERRAVVPSRTPHSPSGSSPGNSGAVLPCSACGELVAQHHALVQCPSCAAKMLKELVYKEEEKKDWNLQRLCERARKYQRNSHLDRLTRITESKVEIAEQQKARRSGVDSWRRLHERLGNIE